MYAALWRVLPGPWWVRVVPGYWLVFGGALLTWGVVRGVESRAGRKPPAVGSARGIALGLPSAVPSR